MSEPRDPFLFSGDGFAGGDGNDRDAEFNSEFEGEFEGELNGEVPGEPEAFTAYVSDRLRSIQPEYAVELASPGELIVNGRRLDLENLLRMVNYEPHRGEEIVEHYLEQLFSGEVGELTSMGFDFIKPRIMPRIQPESIFEHLNREMVAHVPFVNDTVIVFVVDLPHMTVSVTTEQLVRWGVDAEEMDVLARQNLDAYRPEIELQLIESKEGGRAVIVSEQDGYDAARLLMGDLYRRLAPQLGGDFLVATPARDMFVAMTQGPASFIHRLQTRVTQDFHRLPYPISDRFFYVTQDGVAGTLRSEAA